MGCDIHPVIQARESFEHPWEFVEYCPAEYIETRNYDVLSCNPIWLGLKERNYQYFSVLAGVRNSGDITPIDQPRGFPKGFNPSRIPSIYGAYGATYDYDDNTSYDLGDHSFSWVSLRELIDYPYWNQTLRSETVRMLLPSYMRYQKALKRNPTKTLIYNYTNLPTLSPPYNDYVYISEDEAKNPSIATQMQSVFMKNVGVEVIVEYKLRDICSELYEHSIPWLLTLAPSPDDVRLVFGFDS